MADLGGRFSALALAAPFVLGTLSGPAPSPQDRVVRFADHRITESSGLVVVGDRLVTTNDSGDVGRVFVVDPSSGRTVGVTDWSPDAVDVEALAPAGPGAVWVGDIGDNATARSSVIVTRVPVGPGARTVTEPSYRLVYPRGRAVDAETLMSDPSTGRLYVASKEILGGTLYAAPSRLDPSRVNVLRAVGPVMPLANDGSFLPDGTGLVVRGYYGATAYAWPSLQPLGAVPLPDQPQGESLAVEPDGSLLVGSEGRRSWVLRVSLPDDVVAGLAVPEVGPSASPPSGVSGSGAPAASSGSSAASGSAGSGSAGSAGSAGSSGSSGSFGSSGSAGSSAASGRRLEWLGGGVVVVGVVLGAVLVLTRRRRPG